MAEGKKVESWRDKVVEISRKMIKGGKTSNVPLKLKGISKLVYRAPADFLKLDSGLKDTSLDVKKWARFWLTAAYAKRENPKRFKEEYQSKIFQYCGRLYTLANFDFKEKEGTVPSYRDFFMRLYTLTMFQYFLSKDIASKIKAKIIETEAALRVHLAANPKEVDAFLKQARLQATDRSFTTPSFKKRDDKILETLASVSPKIKRFGVNEGPDSFTLIHGAETWEFILFSGPGPFDEGGALIVVRSQDTPEKMITMRVDEIIKCLKADKFDKIVAKANKNYVSETQNAELLGEFDLPKSEKIEYVRLTLDKVDRVITPTFLGSTIFASKLKQIYPKLKIATPILTHEPAKDLRSRIWASYGKGTRHFFIDVYSHGLEDGLMLGDKFTAKDFVTIVEEFPDATFYFSTIGCFGGGFSEGFMKALAKAPKLKDRVSLFFQTKPYVVNAIQGRLLRKGSRDVEDVAPGELSIYQLVLLKSLSEGKTFGQAVRDADKESKRRLYVDPESIIKGQLISKAKKKSGRRRV